MTREETLGIMSVLKAAYPNYYRDMKRGDAESVVGLWTEMFKDEPVELVAYAVKAHIAGDEKGFPPHIGAIMNAIVKLKRPDEMTELEAWGHVREALKNSSMRPESRRVNDRRTSAERSFDALPPIVQRLVGSPSQLADWAMMDEDTVNSVVASNFQRSYKVRAAHEKEMLALPSDVRAALGQIASGMQMPALPEGE